MPDSVKNFSADDVLYSAHDLSVIFGVSKRTIWRWRRQKILPPAIKIGRCVRWSMRDMRAWALTMGFSAW